MLKINFIILLCLILSACGGGDSGGGGGSSNVDHKAALIAEGFDCGPTDELCYIVASGNIYTGSTLNGVKTVSLIASSNIVSNHIRAYSPPNYTITDSCLSTSNLENIILTCGSYNATLQSVELVTSSFYVTDIDQDVDGYPFSVPSYKFNTISPSDIPNYVNDSDKVALLKRYYSDQGYSCSADSCILPDSLGMFSIIYLPSGTSASLTKEQYYISLAKNRIESNYYGNCSYNAGGNSVSCVGYIEEELTEYTLSFDDDNLISGITYKSLTLGSLPSYLSQSDRADIISIESVKDGYICSDSFCVKSSTPLTKGEYIDLRHEISFCVLSNATCSSGSISSFIALNPTSLFDYESSGIFTNKELIICADEFNNGVVYCSDLADRIKAYSVSLYTSSETFDFNKITLTGNYVSSAWTFGGTPPVVDNAVINWLASFPNDDITLPNFPAESELNLIDPSKVEFFTNPSERDIWGHDSDFLKIREPVCFIDNHYGSPVPYSYYSCNIYMNNLQIAECNYNLINGDSGCSVSSEYSQPTLTKIEEQYSINGFDYAESLNLKHSPLYPISIIDAGCEPTHSTLNDKLVALYGIAKTKSGDFTFNSDISSEASRLSFSSNFGSWANTGSKADHCAAVTSIATMNDGAYVALTNEVDTRNSTFFDTVNFYYSNNSKYGLTSISAGPSKDIDAGYNILSKDRHYNSFYVIAAGNNNQNWSNYTTTANLDLSNSLIVGSHDKQLASSDFTGIPGNNLNLQSRFITALGNDLIMGGSIAGTKNYLKISKGTSYSTPLVARAMNIGKALCLSSSYEDIGSKLIESADRSFETYDANIYGMGILDVKAFIKNLQNNGCP